MNRLIVAAIIALLTVPAHADVFNYVCRVKEKSLPVKIDTTRNMLRWQGKTYRIKEQEKCAKYGWHAESDEDSFDFCTATQGVAGFENGGPPKSDCQQKN